MAQYVIEFGSENLGHVVEAINNCLDGPYSIEPRDLRHEPASGKIEASLNELSEALESGELGSVTIRNGDSRIRYGLITSPKLDGCQLSLWMGTIELGVEDWRFVWDRLLHQNGLKFVCVGAEEGVELADGQITFETFPWTEWPLLVGAVRTTESEWAIRDRRAE
jgi:hypothetical protein